MQQNYKVIKCPHCGYEYLPSEIYYPEEYFGKPKNIIRDEEFKIIYFDGESINTKEYYVCDNCKKPFGVDMDVKVKVSNKNAYDFEEDYKAPLYKDKIILEEPKD